MEKLRVVKEEGKNREEEVEDMGILALATTQFDHIITKNRNNRGAKSKKGKQM